MKSLAIVLMACFVGVFAPSPAPAQQPVETPFTNSLGMEFVLVPAGSFPMGTPAGGSAAVPHVPANEQPQHTVTIRKAFYLGKYEVTQAQWQAVMGANPYDMPRTRSSWEQMLAEPGRFIAPQKPATVSWEDAQAFIQRLNALEGHTRYRLPTEAEWEYAARAGSIAAYSFGDDEEQLGRFAWHNEDFVSGSTHPVGQKEPNAWGLYDMHGNVWEWVSDWYDSQYYAKSPAVDPTGPASGSKRVVRGGSWHQTATSWRAAFRREYPPDYRGISIGFRLALSVQE